MSKAIPFKFGRTGRRLIALVAAASLFFSAAPVLAVTFEDQKEAEKNAASMREKIKEADAEKAVLNDQIEEADQDLNTTQAALSDLETELAERRAARDKITAELNTLRAELSKARAELKDTQTELDRLNGILSERAGNIYKNGDISFFEVLLDASSFSDFITRARFLQTIIEVDAELVAGIKKTKHKIERTHKRIEDDTARVAKEEAALTAEVDRVAGLAVSVRSTKYQLENQIDAKEGLVSEIESDQQQWEEAAREFESSAARIKSLLSQSSNPSFGNPSAYGFIWPAVGPVTSPFGPRWGRMHTGIDIAVDMGAPVAASKAGKVVISSWYGGYGNLVVIDHGDGVSTWYGHNSVLIAGVGQEVAQGQVIANAGSTGHSTGPHVHFEIRLNGDPVDPMPYLP